jgi:hypothetical protein
LYYPCAKSVGAGCYVTSGKPNSNNNDSDFEDEDLTAPFTVEEFEPPKQLQRQPAARSSAQALPGSTINPARSGLAAPNSSSAAPQPAAVSPPPATPSTFTLDQDLLLGAGPRTDASRARTTKAGDAPSGTAGSGAAGSAQMPNIMPQPPAKDARLYEFQSEVPYCGQHVCCMFADYFARRGHVLLSMVMSPVTPLRPNGLRICEPKKMNVVCNISFDLMFGYAERNPWTKLRTSRRDCRLHRCRRRPRAATLGRVRGWRARGCDWEGLTSSGKPPVKIRRDCRLTTVSFATMARPC